MISSNKRFLGAICRKAVTLIQRHKAASRKKFAWRTLSTSTSVTTDIEAQGLLDSKGLTVFDTLHQLQETSCEVFSNNDFDNREDRYSRNWFDEMHCTLIHSFKKNNNNNSNNNNDEKNDNRLQEE